MAEGELEIAYCHACGKSMDVSVVAPFSNVECPACGKHTRVKREFGPYTLLRRHAIGGMSVVFIAQDNTLGREVIVKILNEEYGSDEKRISAFEEEARITASFSHPHVVRVFTTGRAFGRFYIAMELVPGGHFEHHIRERGSIPEKEVLPLAHQVAAGLKAAHSAGLIHRDVKPGNILLDASGNAKIVDFGLALVTKGGKAQATEIWATPYYVPPETIEGLPEDFRSDVYAFGATIYHALAGKPPCNEESMDTNRLRDAKKKIAPLAKAAPWISADTCAVVDRAMAHDPLQRYRSYDDLLAALETARQRLASGPATPGPAKKGATKTAGRTSSKAGEKAAVAAASLLVVGALAFGIWWVMQPEDLPVPNGNGTPAPVVTTPTPGSGEHNARVGPAYREAGEALRAGDYSKARQLFAEVMGLPGVLEPTGSWAACEAVVCAYLDGNAGDAKKEARAASEHIQGATGVEGGVRQVLVEALSKSSGFKGVPRDPDAPAATGPDLLAALISGLKNWEQGMTAAALPHFQAVLAAGATGSDAWVAPYQEILRGYLSDAEKIAALDPKKLPETAEACSSLAAELDSLHRNLKTKGRAPFNVRALQLDLERQARVLGKLPAVDPAPPVEDDDVLATVRKNAAECRFSEASALIKSPGFAEKSGKELTAAILLLTEAAGAFLGDLEDKLAKAPANLTLTLRDKSPTGTITGSRSGGLKALDATGSPRDIRWADLSPDSLIELHRQLVKEESSETERLRRHEQAIAFDLLAGDPGRAKEAANVLAARYPAFKRRWDLVQPALE